MKTKLRVWAVFALALALWACGSGESRPVDATVASVEPIRGEVTLPGGPAGPRARVGAGEVVTVAARALARLRLDAGSRLLLGAETRVTVEAEDAVRLERGDLFAQVQRGDRLRIVTSRGELRLGDAEISAEMDGESTSVYVVRGEVDYRLGESRGTVGAGERMTFGASGEPEIAAARLWEDWTGGLARPGLGDAESPSGVGTLEARVPDETGQARWPLVSRRLDVRVRIDGDFAVTEVDQIFFNPASETVEGIYRFRVPEQAVLQRFAVDRDGTLVDGYVRERAQAQRAYESQVYRGSTDDPALLVWDAPGSYRARIYPIGAGETRRILIRYAEWLSRPSDDEPRLYRYPIGGSARPPHVQEFALEVDLSDAEAGRVRAGLGATIEGDTVVLRRSDFVPRADFWLELFDATPRTRARAYRGEHRPPRRAPGARAIPNEADEREYYFLPLMLPARLAEGGPAREGAVDLVIVADISAATDRSRLELGRSVVEALTAHLDGDDRVAIVTSDLTIRPLGEDDAPALGPASPERVEALLDGLARAPAGGATDLGAAIAAAADLLDPARPGAVVYVGDGAPTVGELGAAGLLQSISRLPHPPRLYAVAVGAASNLDLLAALTRGGGLALRVEDRSAAADAALRILAHAGRPLARGVTVDLGSGIDNAFPRPPEGARRAEGGTVVGPVDVVLGETLPIVGRIREGVPTAITVRGTIGERDFEETIPLETRTLDDPTDLRLRWAGERLRQLLLDGEGREAVAELGTRCGLITPFTSYYVPSRREALQGGHSSLLNGPLLNDDRDPAAGAERAVAALLGNALAPLALLGCSADSAGSDQAAPIALEPSSGSSSNAESPAIGTASAPPPAEEAAESDDEELSRDMRHRGEEGEMGRAQRSENRFGIRGPGPQVARERAAEVESEHVPSAAAPAPPVGGEAGDGRGPAPSKSARRAFSRDIDGLPEAPAAEPAPEAQEQANAPGGASSVFSSTAALGADPEDALDALVGSARESEEGDFGGGLGLRGTGRGGGGSGEGTIGLGSLATIGQGGGGGSGSGYGRGAGGLRGRRASVPTIRAESANVRGSLSREVVRRYVRRHINELRFCYERELTRRPDLAGRVSVRFVISPTGAVQSASVASSTMDNASVEGCLARAVQRITFPQPEGGGVVMVTYPFTFRPAEEPAPRRPEADGAGDFYRTVRTTVTTRVTTWSQVRHRPRRCSDAAWQPLDERRALWRERLSEAGGVRGWVRTYRQAIARCEARTWRDRRALLNLIVASAGSVARMIEVHRAFDGRAERRFLRAAIFRRVRTPEDLRIVRSHFGVSSAVDWELVERILERARTPSARIRLLRQLLGLYPRGPDVTVTFPQSFELKLRLLRALEEAGRLTEAQRLAHELRSDPLADAGVRTAIGEMYLRLGDEAEARRVFSEIVEFAPLDAAARRRLGDLYRAHGWFEEAYRQYQTLAQIRPDDPSVLLLLAQAAAGAGRVDEAIRLEQSIAETAEPGAAAGLARVAILWSSVRFAKLRQAAREAHDDERLSALLARMRRSGVLREAGDLRVSLTWSHPDSGLSLWVASPGLGFTRPTDIAPEFGLEAFDLREVEAGAYRFEVRRAGDDLRVPVNAELVIVWNEGRPDERILVRELHFEGDQRAFAWRLEGQVLTDAEPESRREVRR